tara:strand:- start:2833 stop:3171 length:339 start_codon:yes stop_codon:yes gene_type:complete
MANFYKNAFYDPTTTAVTSVYSCPADSRAIIQNIQVTNTGGSKIHQTSVTDSSTTSTVTIAYASISGPTICNVAKGPVILEESDVLKMECNTTDGISAIVSILEINRTDENG